MVFDNKSLAELLYCLPKNHIIINITTLSGVKEYKEVMKDFQIKSKPSDLEFGK